MSRLDEPTDPAFVAEIARMVIDSHERGQRCQRCASGGCDQLDWARLMARQMAELSGERRAAVADGSSGGIPTAGSNKGA